MLWKKSQLLTGENIQPGDVVIGLASNGLHSNGFSLVRKIFLDEHKLSLEDTLSGLEGALGDELLKPTRIYVKPVLACLKERTIHGLAHITGGGFYENIPRMLPEGVAVEIGAITWPVPPIFGLLKEYGSLTDRELFSTFNMGIGMVIVAPADEKEKIILQLEEEGEQAYVLGRVKEGNGISIGGIDQ